MSYFGKIKVKSEREYVKAFMDGYQLYNIQIDDSLKEKTFSYIEKLYNSCPSVEEYAFIYARSQNVGYLVVS